MKNIIYLRVSKEDPELQDPEQQLKALIDKFNLKDYSIIEDRGTAYDMAKVSKRKGFREVISDLFGDNSFKSLFFQEYKKNEINLYVWDFHRLVRNFEYNLLFGLLCDLYGINIYSYKQSNIKQKESETPIDKFSRYMFYSINAFSSEDYSYQTSENIKKSISKDQGVTVSTKGNTWGRPYKAVKGNPKANEQGNIILDVETINKMKRRIKELKKYYIRKQQIDYIDKITKFIEDEYGISLAKSTISKVKV